VPDARTDGLPLLEIQGLRKSFGELEVLRGIDLDVAAGSVLAILGPSGSGKSTLLRCINFLEAPQAGSMRLGELRVDCAKSHKRDRLELRMRTAMVFQGFNLFTHRTVIDNVMEGLVVVKRMGKDEAEGLAHNLLGKVGLVDKERNYPGQLSGGQKQRVAIARALAMSPELMLFDEPTSALDPELVQEVLGVMREVAGEGMMMIVVTHELGFAREVATDVAFMDGGRILERATSSEFFENPREERTRQFLFQITPDYGYHI